MNTYAVNLCDLDSALRSIGPLLMSDFCSKYSPLMDVERGFVDGKAILLDGPAAKDEARLEALVTLLQTVIGPRKIKRSIRVYRQGPRGGWVKEHRK